ncbi:hypothetical protein ACWGJJ_09000, partial [Streptomyces sp. NPDC054787]
VQGPGPGPAPAGPTRTGAAAAGPARTGAAAGAAATGPAAAGPASSGRAVRSPAARDRGQVELAWFAADDPLPFLAMLGALLGRGFGKGARVLRGVPAQGRRTALAAVRAPRQRGRDEPQPAALSRRVPPEAPAEPDELVTR